MMKPGTRVWDPVTLRLATVVHDQGDVVNAVYDVKPDKVQFVPAGRLVVKEGLTQPAHVPGSSDPALMYTQDGGSYDRTGAAFYDHGYMCSAIEQIHTVAVLAIGGDVVLSPEYYRDRLADIAQKCVNASQHIIMPKFDNTGNRSGIVLYQPNTNQSGNTTTQEG